MGSGDVAKSISQRRVRRLEPEGCGDHGKDFGVLL